VRSFNSEKQTFAIVITFLTFCFFRARWGVGNPRLVIDFPATFRLTFNEHVKC